MAQQPGFQPRLPSPPPTGNQAVDQWLRNLWSIVNGMPRLSWFSGTTPNSAITGSPGDLAINLASGSTVSRLWLMGGTPSYVTTLGWRMVAIGPT